VHRVGHRVRVLQGYRVGLGVQSLRVHRHHRAAALQKAPASRPLLVFHHLQAAQGVQQVLLDLKVRVDRVADQLQGFQVDQNRLELLAIRAALGVLGDMADTERGQEFHKPVEAVCRAFRAFRGSQAFRAAQAFLNLLEAQGDPACSNRHMSRPLAPAPGRRIVGPPDVRYGWQSERRPDLRIGIEQLQTAPYRLVTGKISLRR